MTVGLGKTVLSGGKKLAGRRREVEFNELGSEHKQRTGVNDAYCAVAWKNLLWLGGVGGGGGRLKEKETAKSCVGPH